MEMTGSFELDKPVLLAAVVACGFSRQFGLNIYDSGECTCTTAVACQSGVVFAFASRAAGLPKRHSHSQDDKMVVRTVRRSKQSFSCSFSFRPW